MDNQKIEMSGREAIPASASKETLIGGALPLIWLGFIALIVAKTFATGTTEFGLLLSRIGWGGICVTVAMLAVVTILIGWPNRRQLMAGTIAAGLGGAVVLLVVTLLSL
jgi:hypothetical protein